MFEKINVLMKASALAKHAATRQSVVAQNIANADTPGYRAKDVVSFSEVFQTDNITKMRATRPQHVFWGPSNSESAPQAQTVDRPGAMSPNGNSVSLEGEMMAAAAAKRDHDLALTVYKTSLGIMRSALGRR